VQKVWNPQIIVVLPAKTVCGNLFGIHKKTFVLSANLSFQKIDFPHILSAENGVVPVKNSLQKLVWNPQIFIVLPAINTRRKWFGIHK
jgi:hypothetical protein